MRRTSRMIIFFFHSALVFLDAAVESHAFEQACFKQCTAWCYKGDCSAAGCYCEIQEADNLCKTYCKFDYTLTECIQNEKCVSTEVTCESRAPHCDPVQQLGNGKCDPACNVEACEYDVGECEPPENRPLCSGKSKKNCRQDKLCKWESSECVDESSTKAPSVPPGKEGSNPCSGITKRKKCIKSQSCAWESNECVIAPTSAPSLPVEEEEEEEGGGSTNPCSGISKKKNCNKSKGCIWKSNECDIAPTSAPSLPVEEEEEEEGGGSTNPCSGVSKKKNCKKSKGCIWKSNECDIAPTSAPTEPPSLPDEGEEGSICNTHGNTRKACRRLAKAHGCKWNGKLCVLG